MQEARRVSAAYRKPARIEGQARRRPLPGSSVSTPCPTPCRARMQGEYPAKGGVRLRRVCDDGQAGPGAGRLFLCARCHCQVVVCSCCDRGQIYCGSDCAGQARRQTLQDAGKRYQQTHRGRRKHAARMGRFRARRKIVTHHGSPPPPAGDLLAAGAMVISRDDASPAEAPRQATTYCHWCDRPCLPPLRLGFLRRRDHRRGRVDHARTERKPPW